MTERTVKQTNLRHDVISAIKENPIWFSLFVFFTLVYKGLLIIIPLYVGSLIDSLVNNLQRNTNDQLDYYIRIIIILTVIFYFARVFYFWSSGFFDTNIIRNTRSIAFKKLQDQSMRFFSEENTGDILAIYSRDLVRYGEGLKSIVNIITNLLQILGIVVVFLILDTLIGFLLTLFIPILWVILKQFSNPYFELREKRQNQYGKMSKVLDESINTIKITKAYNMETHQMEKFEHYNADVTRLQLEAQQKRAELFPKSRLINQGFTVILLLLGGYRVANGTLSTGDLFIMILLLSILPDPINFLVESVVFWNEFKVSHKRLQKLIYGISEIHDEPNAIDIPDSFSGEITFEAVDFAYKDEPTLEKISFKIQPGSNIALIGTTGSGKTSILNLILRFYDPTAGSIYFDDLNIKNLKISSLRSVIGLVEQETYLFSISIRDNIAIGNPNATFEEIKNAARLASAHEFIMDFEDQYDTIIGKKGLTLSGGQRQRISIARAILFDPKIIIFDDSLSALDTLTESKIQTAIDNLTRTKTTLVVTQRLSTLKNMDNIILMDQGKIIEMGAHNDLMFAQGKYYELLSSQIDGLLMEEKTQ